MIDTPHRRLNPLTREWVLVSPHRAKRPWQGQVERTELQILPEYDPTCYLCPGNERVGGEINAQYCDTFVFDNDFAALINTTQADTFKEFHPLFQVIPERGLCRVVCFSPRHDLTLPELEINSIENVITTWTRESSDLAKNDFVYYVQVFENKGAMMGCSNPHPHSQLWAQSRLPNEVSKEFRAQTDYFADNCRSLLLDYIKEEHKQQDRIIVKNDYFSALVPFWAVWPFEVLIVAHRPTAYLSDLSMVEVTALADLFKQVTIRYDNLFEIPFPYSMGFHQAPIDGKPHPEWVLHAHFYPPLLRSATVRKFMVGYELLAMPQRDITPEDAAERLRAVSSVHYKIDHSRNNNKK